MLRRAGAEVTVASVGALQITASHGIKLTADARIGECAGRQFDCIALPGGMPGAEHLRDSKPLAELLTTQEQQGKLYAAICASPVVVLLHHGLLSKKATCYPSFAGQLPDPQTAGQRVVVDGRCVTSSGPGTAMEFALELVRQLMGDKKARQVAEPMLAATR